MLFSVLQHPDMYVVAVFDVLLPSRYYVCQCFATIPIFIAYGRPLNAQISMHVVVVFCVLCICRRSRLLCSPLWCHPDMHVSMVIVVFALLPSRYAYVGPLVRCLRRLYVAFCRHPDMHMSVYAAFGFVYVACKIR